MNEIVIGLLIGILLLQFVVYFMNLSALRTLTHKQQSTIFGVSHIWGSIMELRKEIEEISKTNELEKDYLYGVSYEVEETENEEELE